ncbi:MAG: ABC transporter permease, partial [Candidatus Heimdallarchaeaceae archaeon]
MTSKNKLIPLTDRGLFSGFNSLMRNELAKWKTGFWWIQIIVWLVLINGIIISVATRRYSPFDLYDTANIYSMSSFAFVAIWVAILAQDSIIGEKKAGTAEWILSKPVSRTAFILSKFFSILFGSFISMALLPGISAYIVISIYNTTWLPFSSFFSGILVLAVILILFLTLTLLLGTIFNTRVVVLGIPILFIILQFFLIEEMLKGAVYFLPWVLGVPSDHANAESIVTSLISGEPIFSLVPIFLTIAFSIIFLFLAI